MPKAKIFYTIHNGGDGSASVQFHADKKAADLAVQIEEEGGEPFGDNWAHSIELEFDGKGRLLNPSQTFAELKRELAERRGEELDENEEETVAVAFEEATTKNDDRQVVAFTGRLSSMTRAQAAKQAEEHDFRFSRYVSSKTDFLVVGAEPGGKLQKALTLGVTLLTEKQWLEELGIESPAPAAKTKTPKPNR